MKKFLQNKKGVTLLEGLIALLLLAMVATGAFAVLLSTSRKSTAPDLQEEMALAIEHASRELQLRYQPGGTESDLPEQLQGGVCGNDTDPFSASDQHYINCALPSICDGQTSSFYYTVEAKDVNTRLKGVDIGMTFDTTPNIAFYITCNGFTL